MSSSFLTLPTETTIEAQQKRALWISLLPIEKALLATDGSFTLLLEALSGEKIQAQVVSLARDHHDTPRPRLDNTPPLRRAVLLHTSTTKTILVYATSIITPSCLPSDIAKSLEESDEPIGLLLRSKRLETFRELYDWGLCLPPALATGFNRNEKVLYRTYAIILQGRPCIKITEYFRRGLY